MLAESSKKASPSEEALIKEFVISNYEIESPFFPSGICSTGSRTLYQYQLGNFKIVLKVSNDFSPGLLRITRTSAEFPCRIYAIAKANPVLQGKGRPNVTRASPVPPKKFKVCFKCFAVIYQGNIWQFLNHGKIIWWVPDAMFDVSMEPNKPRYLRTKWVSNGHLDNVRSKIFLWHNFFVEHFVGK